VCSLLFPRRADGGFLCCLEYIYVVSATTTVNGEKKTVKTEPFNHQGGNLVFTHSAIQY
jgi:hypothetical protein